MDFALLATIFEVSMKGIQVITTLAQNGKDISSAVKALSNIWSKKPEDVTQEDLDETERVLDEMLDEFEERMSKLDSGKDEAEV